MKKRILSLAVFCLMFGAVIPKDEDPLTPEAREEEALRNSISRSEGQVFLMYLRRGVTPARFEFHLGRNNRVMRRNSEPRQGGCFAGSARTRGISISLTHQQRGSANRDNTSYTREQTRSALGGRFFEELRTIQPAVAEQLENQEIEVVEVSENHGIPHVPGVEPSPDVEEEPAG